MLKDWFKLESELPYPLLSLRWARIAAVVSCLLLAVAMTSAQTDQVTNSFAVSVTLAGNSGATPLPGANTAFCINRDTPDSFGAKVIVICQTGQIVGITPNNSDNPWLPVHGGAKQYATELTNFGSYTGMVDGYMSAGTVASWRQVSFTDRDYLEILVAW